MAILKQVLSLFVCTHRRTSFPQKHKAGTKHVTYVACLECGAEFEYDWGTMSVGRRLGREL